MVTNTNSTAEQQRKAKLEAAIEQLKAVAMEYDSTILSLLVVYAGDNLDRLDMIAFNRLPRLAPEATGDAA